MFEGVSETSRTVNFRMGSSSTRQLNIADKSVLCVFLGFGCMLLLLFAVDGGHTLEPVNGAGSQMPAAIFKGYKAAASTAARKLLALSGTDDDDDANVDYGSPSDRIGQVQLCSKDNILIFQGQTTPLPNGIPTYTVQVQNVCVSGSCSISGIHLSCGWFSSARLINPRIFRRLAYDDCLVNDGQPLNPGQSLWFEYANTFSYPMSVSSVSCG